MTNVEPPSYRESLWNDVDLRDFIAIRISRILNKRGKCLKERMIRANRSSTYWHHRWPDSRTRGKKWIDIIGACIYARTVEIFIYVQDTLISFISEHTYYIACFRARVYHLIILLFYSGVSSSKLINIILMVWSWISRRHRIMQVIHLWSTIHNSNCMLEIEIDHMTTSRITVISIQWSQISLRNSRRHIRVQMGIGLEVDIWK